MMHRFLLARRAFSAVIKQEQTVSSGTGSSSQYPYNIIFPKTIKQILESPPSVDPNGGPVASTLVNAWISSRHKSKNMTFLHLTDGSSPLALQLCIPNRHSEQLDEQLRKLTVGCCISARGSLQHSQGHQQSLELLSTDIEIHGLADPADGYPLQRNQSISLDSLRELGHFRQRTAMFQSISRMRNTLTMAAHDFFQSNSFMHVHTPMITANDCEGAGEVFRLTTTNDDKPENKSPIGNNISKDTAVEFFKHPVYLTVSSQLHLEMALGGVHRVYTLSPCFRADLGSEESTRHLAEFYMLEAELSFPENINAERHGAKALSEQDAGVFGLMKCTEELVKSMAKSVYAKSENDVQLLSIQFQKRLAQRKQQKRNAEISQIAPLERLSQLMANDFHRISYTDAVETLYMHSIKERKVKFKRPPIQWGHALYAEHERYLCSHFAKPVFVYNYPAAVKPFYMKQRTDSQGRQVAACFDLLIPGLGEVVGGSVREHSYEKLKQSLQDHGLNQNKELDWYLDLRRYGTCPHGGFGLGFDRLLMYMTGMDNIRDVVQCGRWRTSCKY